MTAPSIQKDEFKPATIINVVKIIINAVNINPKTRKDLKYKLTSLISIFHLITTTINFLGNKLSKLKIFRHY